MEKDEMGDAITFAIKAIAYLGMVSFIIWLMVSI